MINLDKLSDFEKAVHYFEWVIENIDNPDLRSEVDIQKHLHEIKDYFIGASGQ